MKEPPTIEELNLMVRLLLIWNAVLTVALVFCYTELKSRVEEITRNFVDAVKKALA